jgi:hypothetical protein
VTGVVSRRCAVAGFAALMLMPGFTRRGSASGSTAGPSAGTQPASPLATTVDSPPDLPGYDVIRPTKLGAAGRRLPIIVWANGGCVRFDGVWVPLLQRWAAAGYFVVAIGSPPPGSPLSGTTTAADQRAAIDWAVEQNKTAGGPCAGRLDPKRIAAAGNSCGGVTTVQLTGTDRRVKTAFVLSGSGSLPGTPPAQAQQVMSAVTVPIAYVTGGPEDISRANVQQDYGDLRNGVPAYVALRASADHPTLSTTESILGDEIAPISINWFALAFYGSRPALRSLTTDPCPTCAHDLWTVMHKNLDTMVRPSRATRWPAKRTIV